MVHSRSAHRPRPGARLLLEALALLAILALAGWSAAPAQADGDPASDVLAGQQVFVPQDAAIPAAQQSQLTALLRQATRDDYPIRVALIASASDLGSVTELWRHPQSYAQFLGQELSLLYHGPLLVAMPTGFGFYRFARPPAVEQATVATVRPAAGGGALASAALSAVQRLAAAAGHTLSLPSSSASANRGSSDATPWIAFAVGAALIAAAWAASLRVRPPRIRGRARPA